VLVELFEWMGICDYIYAGLNRDTMNPCTCKPQRAVQLLRHWHNTLAYLGLLALEAKNLWNPTVGTGGLRGLFIHLAANLTVNRLLHSGSTGLLHLGKKLVMLSVTL
jgi:hypothetical protein